MDEEYITLSMQHAFSHLIEKKHKISYQELMFFLTVMRDNAEHDDVHDLLKDFLNFEEDQRKKK